MDMTTALKKLLPKVFYILITLLPALLTGKIYQNMDTSVSLNNKLSSITSLGNTIYINLQDRSRYLTSSIYMLSKYECFKKLDLVGISEAIGEFNYTNPTLTNNVYVIDSTRKIVYGLDDTSRLNLASTAHIDSALKGNMSFYSAIVNNKPFLQIAQPIFNEEISQLPVGAIIVTINFRVIDETLNSIAGLDDTLFAYLLDSNGIVIADSHVDSPLATHPAIDINKIKLSINYDPTIPFENTHGEAVNGVYFEIPTLNWTLLITAPEFNGIQGIDFISLLLGGAGAGTLTVSEILKKRKELKLLVDSILLDTPSSSDPPSGSVQ